MRTINNLRKVDTHSASHNEKKRGILNNRRDIIERKRGDNMPNLVKYLRKLNVIDVISITIGIALVTAGIFLEMTENKEIGLLLIITGVFILLMEDILSTLLIHKYSPK